MPFINKDKQKYDPTTEEEREFAQIENSDAEDEGDLLQDDEYFENFDDPLKTKGRVEGSGKKKAIILLLVGVPIVLILFGWVMMGTLKDFGIIGQDKKEEKTAELRISDEEYSNMIEERKELMQRIQTLENQNDNISRNFDEKLAELIKQMQEQSMTPEMKAQFKKLDRDREDLKTTIADLKGQISVLQQETTEPAMPDEPRMGSGSPTVSYSTVRDWNDQKKAEEEAIQEALDNYEAPFDNVAGIPQGTIIPGQLKTTLISSSYLGRFFAVAKTTEPVRIEKNIFLPAGVEFLGKITADFDSRRMIVNVTTLRYNNITLPAEGMMMDKHGNPGMVSKYVDPMSNTWDMLIPNIIAAAAECGQDMVEWYNDDGDYNSEPVYNTENVLRQGVADTMQVQSQIMMEAKASKKPVIIVRKGIPIQIQVTKKIPLDILFEAGIVSQR